MEFFSNEEMRVQKLLATQQRAVAEAEMLKLVLIDEKWDPYKQEILKRKIAFFGTIEAKWEKILNQK